MASPGWTRPDENLDHCEYSCEPRDDGHWKKNCAEMSVERSSELTDVEVAELVRQARQADVRLVRFLYCDNSGLIRGKAAHVDALASHVRAGVHLPMAMQALNILDQSSAVDEFGQSGDVRLVPDSATFTPLSYAPHSAAMLADLARLDGSAWEACPRSFLKRQLTYALRQGLMLQAAFEPEWVIGVRSGDDYVPFDESPALSALGMNTAATIVDEVVAALEAQRIRVEQYHAEFGHAQQELTVHHAPGLRAADQHVLYRETVRSVVFRQGYFASFAAKPWPSQPGNGCHIHFSLWDPTGEHNLVHGEGRPHGISQFAEHFIAGLLDHLPGLAALTCPSYNSYLRLQPGNRATAFVSYGLDNREAAVRLVSSAAGSAPAASNIELRAADPTCNPYLALGGLLAAGLDGVRRELRPGPGRFVTGDPADITEAQRDQRGIIPLPRSLDEAVQALERDELLLDALGSDLAGSFLAVRRSEWAAFKDESSYSQYRAHFWKY
jgi:glutamine synthetase